MTRKVTKELKRKGRGFPMNNKKTRKSGNQKIENGGSKKLNLTNEELNPRECSRDSDQKNTRREGAHKRRKTTREKTRFLKPGR